MMHALIVAVAVLGGAVVLSFLLMGLVVGIARRASALASIDRRTLADTEDKVRHLRRRLDHKTREATIHRRKSRARGLAIQALQESTQARHRREAKRRAAQRDADELAARERLEARDQTSGQPVFPPVLGCRLRGGETPSISTRVVGDENVALGGSKLGRPPLRTFPPRATPPGCPGPDACPAAARKVEVTS